MHEQIVQTEQNQETDKSSYVRRLIGATAACLVFSACASEPNPSPTPTTVPAAVEFNRPPSGEYFLDSPDQYYDNLRSTLELTDDPTAINNIERLLQTPIAQWLNSSIDSTRQAIEENLSQSKQEKTIPVFAAYNIPGRDLGGEARGGLANATEYRDWITAVSDTIGNASSVIILEPDALTGIPQMDNEQKRDERLALLRGALNTFENNNPNTAVYLDAGHSKWLGSDALVQLLHQVDPTNTLVGGIALNVSNQRPESEVRAYADEISQKLGRNLYVIIDNSMNGAPHTADLLQWCNVKGEHIGSLEDLTYNRNQLVEEIFIKAPGESDGRCGESTEPSGEFDPQLLLKQVSDQ